MSTQIVTPYSEFRVAKHVACSCGHWQVTPFDMEYNDVVLCVARHWIDHHDYDYDKIQKWLNQYFDYGVY